MANVFDDLYAGSGSSRPTDAPAASGKNVFDDLYGSASAKPSLGLSPTRTPFDEMKPQPETENTTGKTKITDYLLSAPKGINAFVQGVYSLANAATVGYGRAVEAIAPSLGHQYSLDEAIGKLEGYRPSEVFNDVQDKYQADTSPAMQKNYSDLNNENFLGAVKLVATRPSLAMDMLIQSAPSMAGMVGIVRKAAVTAGEAAIKTAMEQGITDPTHLAKIGQTAAIRAGTVADVLTNAGIEGGQSGAQAKQDVMSRSHDDLMRTSSDYRQLIADGNPQDEAKNILADHVEAATAAVAGAIGGGATLLTGAGAFEARVFGGKAAGGIHGGLLDMAKNIGMESAKQSVQGGGNQLGLNFADQQYIDDRIGVDLMRGVGSRAGAGGALGAMTGGVLHLAGQEAKLRRTNEAPTKQATSGNNSTELPLAELHAKQLANRSFFSTAHPLTEEEWKALKAGDVLSGGMPSGK